MGRSKIFVVEDDPMYAKILKHKLGMDPDFEVKLFSDGRSFLHFLDDKPDIVTLDHSLPDMTGLELLKEIKNAHPGIQVIVLSAQEDVSTALEMLRNGAYDYIIKDSQAIEKLWHLVHQAQEKTELQKEVEILSSEIAVKYDFQEYIKGSSAPMQKVFSLLQKSVNANITVSITGDTGTGKELAAKAIHFNSNRMRKPFVALNVAAIPKELIESELFGYEKGAFTGADQSRAGKFEEANKGTLFLDEIGEMDLNMQAKLLRVLQEREISRLGSNKVIPIDVRIIVATHRDLRQEVKNGNFREDLYYRLMGISVDLPPLRERGNDIVLLAKFFKDQFCKENKIPKKEFAPSCIEKLLKYSYPGNVRELKALVEIATVMSEERFIEPHDIQFQQHNEVDDFIKEELTLEEYNQRIISWFLDKYNHNVIQVADKLGIGKSTIYRMIKEGKIVHRV
jgi:two-component system response regulator AtoC